MTHSISSLFHQLSVSLNVQYPVSVLSSETKKADAGFASKEVVAEDGAVKLVTEVKLIGNPAPNEDSINVQNPQTVKLEKIETKKEVKGWHVIQWSTVSR